MKKGVIELQFHWVFVVIVGAIILLFFANIIFKQKEVTEEKFSADVLFSMNSILTGAIISPSTLHSIDSPGKDVRFDCDSYSVGTLRRTVGRDVVFSPDLLRGRKIIPWALSWESPYKVTNFLFLTTDNVKYVVVNNPLETFEEFEIYGELNITKQLVDFEDIQTLQDTNNYKVKFIFFNELPSTIAAATISDLGIAEADITAVNIVPHYAVFDGTTYEHGEIDFYRVSGGRFVLDSTKPFLRMPSVYGAIFAEDAANYDCSMKKAFRRLGLVTDLYIKRNDFLFERYNNMLSSNCEYYYRDEIPGDATVIPGAKFYFKEIKSYSADFTEETVFNLHESSKGLKQRNSEAKLASCPLIY